MFGIIKPNIKAIPNQTFSMINENLSNANDNTPKARVILIYYN